MATERINDARGLTAHAPPAPEPHDAETLVLDGSPLTVAEVVAVARRSIPVTFDAAARGRVGRARSVVEAVLDDGVVVYGINTGFGDLSRVRISSADLATLQGNLVRSHAAGVGDALPREVVRATLLILAASLCRAHSGVRPIVVEHLIEMLNHDVVPVVPETGSLGASGDLAPLAHVALVLIGEGEAFCDDERIPGLEALEHAGLQPLQLLAKEGLALINGTHVMTAIGALSIWDARTIIQTAEVAAATSLEALRGTDVPFDARIHALRAHSGQVETAAHVRSLLEGSEIIKSHRIDDPRVQDPYSLRCIPQVVGAIRNTLEHCSHVIETELACVTDNPLCFPDDDVVLSGGNFHGQPVALALDILAIAMAELAAFTERRIYLLLDDREPRSDRLPAFLAREPGLNSGYMIAQYVAAGLIAENAVLAVPAGLHSVPTSAGMEDFVSMGATAANKLRRIIRNTEQVVAIELLCAAEGIEYRRPLQGGDGVEEAVGRVRALVPRLEQDRSLHPDILAVSAAVHAGQFAL